MIKRKHCLVAVAALLVVALVIAYTRRAIMGSTRVGAAYPKPITKGQCQAKTMLQGLSKRSRDFSKYIAVYFDPEGSFRSRNVAFTFMRHLAPRGWDFHFFVTRNSIRNYRANESFVEAENKKRLTYTALKNLSKEQFVAHDTSIVRAQTAKHVADRSGLLFAQGLDHSAAQDEDDLGADPRRGGASL